MEDHLNENNLMFKATAEEDVEEFLFKFSM